MSKKLKPINLELQRISIINHYPEWRCNITDSKLICVGQIKPSPLSNTYEIELTYILNKQPIVNVLNPTLERKVNGIKTPHLYKDGSLCLYHPRFNEWDKSKKISQTIIPWASLWLYYYEVWLATGIWKGGGIHPN